MKEINDKDFKINQQLVDRQRTANNIGFAARLAGRWSNDHFIAIVLHLGWTNIAGLLFVNLYFYIFNQSLHGVGIPGGHSSNSSPAASPCSLAVSLTEYLNDRQSENIY
ncbi:MAG: hypothetical protein IPI88_15565 [Chitinophagaceae bacterium]|nr:hypothetical protein [Chitinophagaceae bacterium]